MMTDVWLCVGRVQDVRTSRSMRKSDLFSADYNCSYTFIYIRSGLQTHIYGPPAWCRQPKDVMQFSNKK